MPPSIVGNYYIHVNFTGPSTGAAQDTVVGILQTLYTNLVAAGFTVLSRDCILHQDSRPVV